MIEMVYGMMPIWAGEPILFWWWWTVDRVALFCVVLLFMVGLLLGFAVLLFLAECNNLPPFYYVER